MKILIHGGCLDTCIYLHFYINIMKNFNSTLNFLIFNSIFYMLPKGRGRGNLFFFLFNCLFVCLLLLFWVFFWILRYVRGWDFWLINTCILFQCMFMERIKNLNKQIKRYHSNSMKINQRYK